MARISQLKRTGPKGIDWTAVETRYVMGNEPLREIAQAVGVSLRWVSARSKQRGWTEKRRQHRQRVAQEVESQVGKELARVLRDMVPQDLKRLDQVTGLVLTEYEKAIREGSARPTAKDAAMLLQLKHRLATSPESKDTTSDSEDAVVQRLMSSDVTLQDVLQEREKLREEILKEEAAS